MCLVFILPSIAQIDLAKGDIAQVGNTDGEGVLIRNRPSTTADVLAALPEGHPVTIVVGPATAADGSSWYGVTAETPEGPVTGWIHADYLEAVTSAPAQTETETREFRKVCADGEGLNLRDNPSLGASILTAIPEGTEVEVLAPAVSDAESRAWSQISYGGTVGYSASEFLRADVEASAEQEASGMAVVTGTDGDGVYVREAPGIDSAPVTTLFEGAPVNVVADPAADSAGDLWYQVDHEGTLGWVYGPYLSVEEADPTAPRG